jgi:uncharacterized membrane protein YhdT
VQYPNSLEKVLRTSSDDKISVSFSITEEIKPQQVEFILISEFRSVLLKTHDKFQWNAFLTKESSSYKLNVGLKDLKLYGGDYKMKLVIGEYETKQFINWNIGKINLKLPEAPVRRGPSNPNDAFFKLSEIHHVFKQAEKRPNAVISYLFTLLVLIPWVIVFYNWSSIGIRLDYSRLFKMSSVVFIASLLAVIALFYFAFMYVTLFNTLRIFSALSVIVFFSGRNVLRAHAENKLQKK